MLENRQRKSTSAWEREQVCIFVGAAQPCLSLDGAQAEGTCAERSSSGDAGNAPSCSFHPAW